MIHALLIAIVIVTLAHDGLRQAPLFDELPAWTVVAGSLGPQLALLLIAHIGCVIAGRRLDSQGDWRAVTLADWSVGVARVGSAIVHGVAVLALGWLDCVRDALGGNIPLLDEAVAVLPPVAVIALSWWSYYPVERRLREAIIVRQLHTGDSAVLPIPTRGQYLLDQTRHNLLFVLAPVGLIALWTEGVDWALDARRHEWAWIEGAWGGRAAGALHLLGVVLVLTAMPLLLRYLWNTVPLGAGAMRDRLMRLCEVEGVGCRDLLVWRTRSGMLNGAVVGILPRLRYILLTDALLERLPPAEVEAVMAHEVAHARRRHLPWLMIAMLASVGAGWVGMWKLLGAWLGPERFAEPGPMQSLGAMGALGAAVLTGFLIFGFVSRRFEQQADAFAAQHLSGWTRASRSRRDVVITPEAVAAMAGALGRVAAYNHIPLDRFSWRHGSIRSRQRRLRRLAGLQAHCLPVDRLVFSIKVGSLIALGLVVGAFLMDPNLPAL